MDIRSKGKEINYIRERYKIDTYLHVDIQKWPAEYHLNGGRFVSILSPWIQIDKSSFRGKGLLGDF